MSILPKLLSLGILCDANQLSPLRDWDIVRIALTITELDPGGAEQCLVQLAIYLISCDHQVQVFALGKTPMDTLGGSPRNNHLTDLLDHHNIPWLTGPAENWLSIFSTTRWLSDKLERFQPDVIQSMLFHANVVTALANRRVHAVHFGGVRVTQPSRWRRWLQNWAARRMQRVICVSRDVASHCEKLEKIPSTKLVVIPNGISLDASHTNDSIPHQPNTRPPRTQEYSKAGMADILPNSSTPFLLFVGRLTEQKGIDLLMQQVDSLLGSLPNFHWVLLGDGPLKQQLQATILTSENRQRIHLLGWQPNALEWIQACSLLLVPSRYEGMPNVILEAMSVARPVVTFPVEGASELLGDCPQQIVQGSINEFIARVHSLAKDSTELERLGKNNRIRVEHCFELRSQLAKYERLYSDSLLQLKGRSS